MTILSSAVTLVIPLFIIGFLYLGIMIKIAIILDILITQSGLEVKDFWKWIFLLHRC